MQFRSICLIVPVYNEYKRLLVEAYCAFIASDQHVHIIFVDDASVDDSGKLLYQIKQFCPSRVEIVHHSIRSGKAEAIRTGMLKGMRSGDYQYFGFIDADLAVPLTDISLFTERLKEDRGRMAIGIRTDANKGTINRTALREIMGNLFRAYLHNVLHFLIVDSQCGAKVFSADIVSVLYENPFKTRWLSDVEIIMRYRHHLRLKNEGIEKYIIQIPVSKFEDKPDSKVNFIELLRTLKELIIITINSENSSQNKKGISFRSCV